MAAGVELPLLMGEPVPGVPRIVGWPIMLNIEVTGGLRSGVPVCCDINGGLECMVVSSLLENMADADMGGAGSSTAGVGGMEPISLEAGEAISLFSSSSRMAPKTLRTMLPTVSSLGAASTSLLPTSWTRTMSFPGSVAFVLETTFLSSQAVARAHCLGPRICRLRSNDTRYSIDLSTGQDGKFARKDARPGGGGKSAAMADQAVSQISSAQGRQSGGSLARKIKLT